MKKKSHQLEDFFHNASFRRWTLEQDSESAAYWINWLETHPEEEEKLRHAQAILRKMKPAQLTHTAEAQHRVWQMIQEAEKTTPQFAKKAHVAITYWRRAAVIMIPLIGAALFYWWLLAGNLVSVSTNYGEIQNIELPDGSKLTLNANSSISYHSDWSETANREVWLEGEAFFQVKKLKYELADSTSLNTKFTVHTDHIDIEVLGTTFSVNHRNQETQVILTEGRVKVVTKASTDEDIIMNEGEMVSYGQNQIKLSKVDTSTRNSWKDKLVIFQDESLKSIFLRIENTYGLRIEVDEPALLERRFSGSFPRDSVEILFDKMAKLYRLDISKQKNEIIISD